MRKKYTSKSPHIRQKCWIGFMKGVAVSSQEGPMLQDTGCSGTRNSDALWAGVPGFLDIAHYRHSLSSPLSGELPVTPWPLQPWQHSPPLKSMKLQAFITSGGPVRYRVSWQCGTFHTHPLHCSACRAREVNWQHLSTKTLQTEREMEFANGTERFYKCLHFTHIYPAFTGICQLSRVWCVSIPCTPNRMTST